MRTASLNRGELLTVTDGEATTLRVDSGEVWLTEDGSFIDHVLGGGQTYAFDRPGIAVITAQVDSHVSLLAPVSGPPPARVATARSTLYQRPLWWMVAALAWPASWRRSAML